MPVFQTIDLSGFIPLASMDNSVPMVDDATKVLTAHSAYQGDVQTAELINKVQSTAIANGAWPILRKATTNSSGIATIYLTTDGTSGTAAAFGTVYEDGIVAVPIGSASNYQVVSIVLDGTKKFITVTVNQLGSVVLGLVNVTSAASGVEVRAAVWGK